MLLARRKFIATSLLFGTSYVLFGGNTRLGFARTLIDDGRLSDDVLRNPLYSFTRETFEPYVGGYFEAAGPRGQMIAMKLLKVEAYTPKEGTKLSNGPTVETESFSLLFSAESALPLFPSIYQIKHGALGEFSLFLTPRNGPNREIFYEAVFNRIR